MNCKHYIETNESVVVVFTDGSMRPVPVENPMYQTVVGLLKDGKMDEIEDVVDKSKLIKKHSNGKFYVLDGIVYVEGEVLPDALSDRLLAFADSGLPVEPLVTFWDNLKKNPSENSRKQLYPFLEQNNIPITADGCFVAYKRVDSDFKDCYTHTFDNSVGARVTMKREDVDEDSTRTCSRGLHVAAFPYAKSFYSDGYLMEVKVNPRDVVAVPDDYNGQKMRVCMYEVMREYDKPRSELLLDADEYDETADQDVFDDAPASSKGETDASSVDVGGNDEETVRVDGRGRVCLPARMVRALGLSEGDLVFATSTKGVVAVEVTQGAGVDSRGYTVDASGNVRISANALKDSGLGRRKNLTITLEDGTIYVE